MNRIYQSNITSVSLPEGVEGNVRSDLGFLNNFSPCGANSIGKPRRVVSLSHSRPDVCCVPVNAPHLSVSTTPCSAEVRAQDQC